MRGERGELPGAAQGFGDAFAALDALRNRVERIGDALVAQNRARDVDGLHQGHGIGNQRGHGARETRRLGLAQRVAQHRNPQPRAVPPQAAIGRCDVGLKRHHAHHRPRDPQPAPGAREVRHLDHDARGHRHLQLPGFKDAGKARHHEIHQHQNGREAHQRKQRRVHHGPDNVVAQLIARALEFRQPLKNLRQRARRLARAHHIDVELGEVPRMRA